jgi:hypothetical protein
MNKGMIAKIKRILKKNGATKAAIFGSYARGEQKKKSDIDILVEISDKKSLLDFIGIQLELEKALKKKVDLVEYECIKPLIRESVLSSLIPII